VPDEALGMSRVGGVENDLTAVADGRGQAVVNHGGSHHADSGVTMIVVVLGKESLAEGVAVLKAAETIRELGAILQGAEVAFRIRIVVGGVGPAGSW
jgi:hypothetical protein